MRDLQHILLPTDFSENSRSALPAAVALARRFGATLHLLHVAAPLPWPAHEVLGKGSVPTLGEEVRLHSEKNLRDLAAEATGVETEIHVEEGRPADAIERFVAGRRIDLVTIATKGQTGLTRFMLGSVAEKVVRHVACPVLVVRRSPASWDSLARILVPADFSELSELALAEAIELARPNGAEILVAHILEETDYPTGHVLKGHGILNLPEQTRKAVQARLEDLRKAKIGAQASSRIVTRDGVPSAAIAWLAEQEAVDVVVIATHARKGLARFILGSTAERVVRIAPCSVLVVKERDL